MIPTTAYVWVLVIELASGIPDQNVMFVRVEQESRKDCLFEKSQVQKRIDRQGTLYEKSVKCKYVKKELTWEN
jgi:glycosylphosphatidylinositol transamidase (GPIT) subunit GPI8